MSAKTKIVVLRMKEVIRTGILAAVGLFLIILLLLLSIPGKDPDAGSSAPAKQEQSDTIPAKPASSKGSILQESCSKGSYLPGIYKTELELGGHSLEVEVILEKDSISSLRLVEPSSEVLALYPLLAPSMENIRSQLVQTQSLDSVTGNPGSRYTSMILLNAVRDCLKKGSVNP